MKITRLVILFNKSKILIGLFFSLLLFFLSNFIENVTIEKVLVFISVVICFNIILALFASYVLYDKSNLFHPKKLFKKLDIKENEKGVLIHASFDPVSGRFEKMFSEDSFGVYNIYGNRHEDESAIKHSEKLFPPNKKEIKIKPESLQDADNSLDYIFAITSLHEILTHKSRVVFFEEAKRVLNENGRLFVCEQTRSIVNYLFFNFGALHFVSDKNWQLAIKESGLELVKKESLTPFAKIYEVKPPSSN